MITQYLVWGLWWVGRTVGSMASPRKRLSLGISAGNNKSNKFGPMSPTSPGVTGLPPSGFSLAAAHAGNKQMLRKPSSKAWPYAPRSARYRLVEARDTCGSTPAQFAQAISAIEATPVNQQQLLAMEAGFALVPTGVLNGAERLYADHQSELARQDASRQPAVMTGGEYPYQEPMEGCARSHMAYPVPARHTSRPHLAGAGGLWGAMAPHTGSCARAPCMRPTSCACLRASAQWRLPDCTPPVPGRCWRLKGHGSRTA